MKNLRLVPIVLALACGSSTSNPGDDGGPDVTDDAGPTYLDCAASDQAFVRSAFPALIGRRPLSQAEVQVYADIMSAVRELAAPQGDAGPVTDADPRQVVTDLIMQEPGFIDRWSEHFTDALRVARIEVQSMRSCYGDARQPIDDGALATYIRDNGATANGIGEFTMLDLLRSALVLDDMSPVYRGHLFALLSRPIPAANVPLVQAELARREDFGLVFDAAYLNRDMVCLGCHNSEGSVTQHPDPELNRHWPLPGHFETALFGAATGTTPERAHAMFRYDGLVANLGDQGDHRPWDWDTSCGGFNPFGLPEDPAGVDGLFGNLTGTTLTVYQLEESLKKGFDTIATTGLPLMDNGSINDPDAAFAYMVSATIVESVWEEVIGSPLTIVNYFPRNQQSRDLLHQLTESFVANHYSLKQLLADIVQTPFFNRLEPAAGCGSPYNMPPVYDPWVIAEDDEERRKNGAGDAVMPLSPRVLIRAAYAALEWRLPFFVSFPEFSQQINSCDNFFSCAEMAEACADDGTCCLANEYLCINPPGDDEPKSGESRAFQRGIGVFLKNGEHGFRGLDFQARLVFEDRFAACRNRTDSPDFIDAILLAAEQQSATVGDVVAAVKDRLVGEARVSHEELPGGTSELAAVEALFNARLDQPVSGVPDMDTPTREFCGALVSSPQFLLSGLAAPDSSYVPLLTPGGLRYDSVCSAVQARGIGSGLTMTCGANGVSVAP